MVIFWDTSAVVPLLVAENTSPAITELAQISTLLVWWGTPVECLSAIARREGDATLTSEAADQARRRLSVLRESWSELTPSEQVRENAERALLRHPLRAADALQLGAALRWAENSPKGHRFHTLDGRLTEAARKEGFEVIDAGSLVAQLQASIDSDPSADS
jgi:predicted nucleic acid-binding protein